MFVQVLVIHGAILNRVTFYSPNQAMQGAVRASSVASGSLLENLANRFYVGEQRAAHEFQAFDRSLRSFAIPGAASISHNHGNVTKVGSVPHCWFDSELHRHAESNRDAQREPAIRVSKKV